MLDIFIGLFINILAQFIHNPETARKYVAELSHIQNGVTAVLTALQPKAEQK